MNYLSLSFALFVMIAVAVFYIVPVRLRGWVLLAASVGFYLSFDWRYLFFLLFTALSTFWCGKFFCAKGKKKTVLILCIAVNVAVWVAVKFIPALNWDFSSAAKSDSVEWIVPVGISYYLLQSFSYLIDVYKEKTEPEKRFWKYLLFLSYFPAVVQGPISRYDQLAPQLQHSKKPSFEDFRDDLVLILFGMVKKMVVADRLGIFVNRCFTYFEDLNGLVLYVGAVCYAIQLYMDFSGCVDICRGVSGLFCIDLPQNFRGPYLSRSIKEFWGRWHMTLSSWLKDYIYIPLGGNRKGKVRKYWNLAATFLVSGVWHGVGLNFLVWGLLHAVYQIIGELTHELREKVRRGLGIVPGSVTERLYRTVITFNLTVFAWIFFRAESLEAAFGYIGNMFSQTSPWAIFSFTLYGQGVNYIAFTILAVHVCVITLVDWLREKQIDAVKRVGKLHLFMRWSIYLLLIFDVLLFGVYGKGYNISSFLYGGF